MGSMVGWWTYEDIGQDKWVTRLKDRERYLEHPWYGSNLSNWGRTDGRNQLLLSREWGKY